MHIREAVLQDCRDLAVVQITSYHTAYRGLLSQQFLDHFTITEQEEDWRVLLNNGQGKVYAAEESRGRLVGYALVFPPQDNIGELAALHVLPDSHRQGAGRALFTRAARWLVEQGAQSLIVWVLAENPAREFYEHLGGEPAGEKSLIMEDLNVDAQEVAYRWPDLGKLLDELEPIPLIDCRRVLPPKVVEGIALFNQGLFFEAHEALEAAWREEAGPIREMYRGILQVAVGYYHLMNGNRAGALKMFKRARQWLEPLQPI